MEMPQCVGRTTAILFSSLHGIEFAHFCCYPAPNTLGNTELHSETQAHCSQIIRLLLLAGSGARDGWEPKGKSPKGRAAMAGLACGREPWQPWGSGAAAAARLGRPGRLERRPAPPGPLAGCRASGWHSCRCIPCTCQRAGGQQTPCR